MDQANRSAERRRAWIHANAGVLAGAIAGAAGAAVFAVLGSLCPTGAGPLFSLPLVVHGTVGPLPDGAFTTALLGGVIHLGVGATWGALLGEYVPRRASARDVFVWQLCYGLAVLLVMTLFVLPVFAAGLSLRAQRAPLTWIGLHVVFGACLVLVVPIRAALVRASRLERDDGVAALLVRAATALAPREPEPDDVLAAPAALIAPPVANAPPVAAEEKPVPRPVPADFAPPRALPVRVSRAARDRMLRESERARASAESAAVRRGRVGLGFSDPAA